MSCSKRFVPVIIGCFGTHIYGGYACIVSVVMVHILISDDGHKDEDSEFLKFNCLTNASSVVSKFWKVSTLQYLHCAYYVGYFSTQLLGGYLASRFSPKMVLGIVTINISILLLAIPTAIKTHFILVFVIRVAQGLLEGCASPALNGVISAWTPKSEKSRMFTIIMAGGYLSPAVAFPVAGITSCVLSWDASLYIYGGCGVLWSCIWFTFIYDTPMQHPGLGFNERLLFEREGPRVQPSSDKIAEKIPWRKLFTSLPLWAIVFCSFCRHWMHSCMVNGIPQYFETAFTTDIAKIGLEAALPAVFVTITMIIGGVLIDKVIKSRLVSTTIGRKIAQCIGFGGEACCFLCLRFTDRQDIALILLCVGIAFGGLSISGYSVNPLDLAPQYVSILTGFYRFGVLGGVLNTAISGSLHPKNIEAWQNIFTISASGLIAAAAFYGIFASGERQNWVEDPENTSLIN